MCFFLTRVICDQLFLQKFVFDVCFIFLSRLVLWILKNFAVSWLLCRMSRRWIDVCCLDVTHCGWLGSKHQLTDYLTDCCKVTGLVTFSLRLMLNPSRAVCVIILPSVLLATDKRESACLAVTEAEFLASPLAEVWESWFEFSCTFTADSSTLTLFMMDPIMFSNIFRISNWLRSTFCSILLSLGNLSILSSLSFSDMMVGNVWLWLVSHEKNPEKCTLTVTIHPQRGENHDICT